MSNQLISLVLIFLIYKALNFGWDKLKKLVKKLKK